MTLSTQPNRNKMAAHAPQRGRPYDLARKIIQGAMS